MERGRGGHALRLPLYIIFTRFSTLIIIIIIIVHIIDIIHQPDDTRSLASNFSKKYAYTYLPSFCLAPSSPFAIYNVLS